MKRLLLAAIALLALAPTARAQRITDALDRGIVAVPAQGGGRLVTWRMFGEEYYDTQYNLYRNGTKVNAEPLSVSNFIDTGGSATSTYQVEPIVHGVIGERSASVKSWANNWLDVRVKPVVNRAGKTIGNSVAGNTSGNDTTTPGYTLNDVSLADVDGDGVVELIVKRNNSQGNLRQASNKTDFNLYECYKLNGERLWWIDLGPNLMAGADEQWDMVGYDWDQDGKAEMIMRGADNMIIHTASGATINIGNMNTGFGSSDRPEYTGTGNEYLLYLNGETGEPYGWNGQQNWTPQAYPLPQFEKNETTGDANVWGDLGHRMQKHYIGAPYIDGRKASIFLGRGCYTRIKACALDVNPTTHELTVVWRWNCYEGGSPWFGNGFHNFAIADVDMDGRDEIVYGSMILDDTGYGLATTGLGHGDAQHCGDLDPYRWGLEQFTCQEGAQGNSYWNATTGQLYYRKSDGGDDGRALAGNFTDLYPGGQGRSVSSGVIGLSCDKVVDTNGDAMSGSYANLNNRIYWDGDLLDEIFSSKNGANRPGHIFKWGGNVITTFDGITNNWTKCNPSAQGDIIGDWREEVVLRLADNSALRIYTTNYPTEYGIYTLWHDHQYRNAMAWQCVGYNQPPHPSFFLGNVEKITVAPPPLILRGRTELSDGATIQTTNEHLLISGYEDKTITVADGAEPYILTVNAPAWVQGTGAKQAVSSTPKSPQRKVETYTTTLTGGAFGGETRLVKQGEGVLVLPNVVEKHSGNTDVWNGTLVFGGTMEKSPVWLNRHTTLISDGGQFLGGLKADYNATIQPGGADKLGSVSASKLELGFGSRVVFDVNGENIDKLNAKTMVVEKKTWQYGPKYKTPIFEFNNVNDLADGKYEIGQVDEITGDISDILVEGISGRRFELLWENRKVYLLLETMRQPTTVVWNGTSANNVWDLAVTENFLLDGESVFAVAGDDVVFNDEASSGTVVVKGAVSPKSITFDNSTKAYTLKGDSILGEPTLTKNGTARLTVNNENRMGATTINGGTLSVNALANNTGITYGALGNVKQTITINDGAALSVSMPVITDQRIYVKGNATLDVPSGISFTINKGLIGSGSTVTKTGSGGLTTGASNTYSLLIIKAGSVSCNGANNIDQLPKTVEFQGGTLWAANNESTNISNSANLVVPKGKTGTFYGGFRSTYTGTLTGEGTFNVYTGGVRCYFDGDWSQFSGTINVGKNNRQNKKTYDPSFMYRNTKGLPNATVNVQQDVMMSNEGKDMVIGKVTGSGTLTGSGRWILGSNDKDFYMNTEIGVTYERKNAYGGNIGKSTSPVVKRGAGRMMMQNVGKINGTLTVEQGTVSFNNADLSTLVNGSNATTIKNGGRLTGQGLLYSLAVESGGEVIPCGSYLNEKTPGTLKVNQLMRFDKGSTVTFLFNGIKKSTLQTARLTMNGTITVMLLNDYTPKSGDEFTLWTATGSVTGTPTFDLPELPDGLTWDTSGLTGQTGMLRVVENSSAGIGDMLAETPVTCEVFTASGLHVTTFQCVKAEATTMIRRKALPQGTYILKMQSENQLEVKKVVVK